MYDLLKQVLEIPAPFNMVVVIVFLISVAGVITAFAKEIRKIANHRMDLDMKREMLERGMGAEEIERVIQAGGGSGKSKKS